MLPDPNAPAQEWIDAGVAVPDPNATGRDFKQISFRDAHLEGLIHLTESAADEGAENLQAARRRADAESNDAFSRAYSMKIWN